MDGWREKRFLGLALVAIAGVAVVLAKLTGVADPGDTNTALSLVAALWAGVLALRGLDWQRGGADSARRLRDAARSRERAYDQQVMGTRPAGSAPVVNAEDAAVALGVDSAFVTWPWAVPVTPSSGAARPGGLRSDVAGYFCDFDERRLVVLGRAGSGKSELASQLARKLLADWKDGEPVPVRVLASTWRPDDCVVAWAAGHVSRLGPSAQAARQLVESGQVLLVVDGVDRIVAPGVDGASLARSLIAALNRFQVERNGSSELVRIPLVLTCTEDVYRLLGAGPGGKQVAGAAHVQMLPVAAATAAAYLRGTAGVSAVPSRWEPVCAELWGPTPVNAVLTVPLYLHMAVVVFGAGERAAAPPPSAGVGGVAPVPGDLAAPVADEGVREVLLHHFARVKAHAVVQRGWVRRARSARRVHEYLGVLARYLASNAGAPPLGGRGLATADLVLHELWPLAGRWRARVLSGAVVGVLTGGGIALALVGHGGDAWQVRDVVVTGAAALLVPWWVGVTMQPWPPLAPWVTTPGAGSRSPRGRAAAWMGAAALVAAGAGFGALWGAWWGQSAGAWAGFFAAGAGAVVLFTPGRGGGAPLGVLRTEWVTALPLVVLTPMALGLVAQLALGGWAVPGAAVYGLGLVAADRRVGLRYVALLVCVLGWLPWRLGRFLDQCAEDGLMREAGGESRQFRHAEVQAYFAANPGPPP